MLEVITRLDVLRRQADTTSHHLNSAIYAFSGHAGVIDVPEAELTNMMGMSQRISGGMWNGRHHYHKGPNGPFGFNSHSPTYDECVEDYTEIRKEWQEAQTIKQTWDQLVAFSKANKENEHKFKSFMAFLRLMDPS